MNSIQKIKELHQQATIGLNNLLEHSMGLKRAVEQSTLSERLKSGYLKLLNKKISQLETLKQQLATPQQNYFQTFTGIREQSGILVNIKEDLKKIKEAFETANINTMPVAPTGPVIIQGRQSSPPRTPDYVSKTIEKFTNVQMQLKGLDAHLLALNSSPTTTTEHKVERVAKVTGFLKSKTALQTELDTIGRTISTTRTTFTKAECASLDQRLAIITQKMMSLQSKITIALMDTAPAAPTHSPIRPR